MTRHTWFLAVAMIVGGVAGCAHNRGAQPPSMPSPRATTDEASRLDTLVERLHRTGNFQEAIPLAERSLALRETALGPRHSDVATSLYKLAKLYEAQGAYAKAEPLYVRALDIRERALGATHPRVATSLTSLAKLYQVQSAYAKAEPLMVRALDIRESALGAMHPEVAHSLNNLASLYKRQGAYAKAEPLYLRALDINEKAWGPMHPEVAKGLNNLGALYDAQGAQATAESLVVRAFDIDEKVLGAMHPDMAQSLHGLARLYQAQSAYAKAEPLYLRALDINEKAWGAMHPAVAKSLNHLAMFYRARGAYAKAEPLVARAAELREAQLRLEIPRLSESRKRALMMLLQGETDSVVSLHADAMTWSPQALELALTTVLRRKARFLDSLADHQVSLRGHLTPALRDPPSEPITIAKIQAALPRGAALVEFVRYHRVAPEQALPQQEARYVAYVVPWQGTLQWVALGEAAPIDAAIDAVLAAMREGTRADAAKAALQHLDTLVFAPLRGWLTSVSHVILSPDGKLNLVPFDALVEPQGHDELAQRQVSYVTSGRDLLRLATRHAPRSSSTIVAAPDHDRTPLDPNLLKRPGHGR